MKGGTHFTLTTRLWTMKVDVTFEAHDEDEALQMAEEIVGTTLEHEAVWATCGEFDPDQKTETVDMRDGGTGTAPSAGSDLVTTLNSNASLAATLANPNITLPRAAATYILYKRRRLTTASERGYRAILDDFTSAVAA